MFFKFSRAVRSQQLIRVSRYAEINKEGAFYYEVESQSRSSATSRFYLYHKNSYPKNSMPINRVFLIFHANEFKVAIFSRDSDAVISGVRNRTSGIPDAPASRLIVEAGNCSARDGCFPGDASDLLQCVKFIFYITIVSF